MEDIRIANELADEPKEIQALVKDWADGNPDEENTQHWIDKIKATLRSCQDFLETFGVGAA